VTSTGAVLGTFAYLSPEQARGLEIGPRSDVYAAGLILYEMLTGVAPPGDEVALPLALRDARERCPPPSELAADTPPELDAIVMRCLERDPSRRFATAEEVANSLDGLPIEISSSSGRAAGRRSTARLWLTPSGWRARWMIAAAALAIVSTAGLAFRARWTGQVEAATPVIAVLPLTNLSTDSSAAHLGVGIADVLVAQLASSPRLTVLSATGTLHPAQPPSSVAHDLGASHVLSGSLQSTAGRVRIALTLLRAQDSVAIAVGDEEAPMSQIFDLQARMAQKVMAALKLPLTEETRRRMELPHSNDIESFAEYSHARSLLQQRDVPGNVESAIRILEGVTQKEPGFALAHAALGEACLSAFNSNKDPQWANRASTAILQALSLDPEPPQVRLSLAMSFQASGKLDQAETELRRTIAEHPHYDDAHRLLGVVLAERGDIDAGAAQIQRAIALRPDYWEHHAFLGRIYYLASRYSEAAAAFKEVVRLRPGSDRGYLLLGAAQLGLGENDAALATYERAHAISPSPTTFANIATIRYWTGDYRAAAEGYRKAIELKPNDPMFHFNLADAENRRGAAAESKRHYRETAELLKGLLALNANDAPRHAFLAVCQLELGERDSALQHAEEALALSPKSPEIAYRAATVYAGLGRTDKALAKLREALDGGYSVVYAQNGSGLDPLRRLPEFKKIMDEALGRQKDKSRRTD
jgi:tetratricopeptide (TPR) repeat protein/TolB-like protein